VCHQPGGSNSAGTVSVSKALLMILPLLLAALLVVGQ
jgi:hypothetical protein